MWRIVAIATGALAFLAPQRAHAADGGAGEPDQAKGDSGTQTSVPRPIGPAGTFLGPLPSAAPERRYTLKRHANGGLYYEAPQFSAEVAPDGTVTFHDRRLRYSAPKVMFSFDLTDEFVHESTQGTLYPYEKANFLAATFERRTEMAAKWYAGEMRAATKELPLRLDALWADTRYRRRERRRIICLLWGDLDTSTSDARPAATIIEAWIRKRLPPGSSDAYTNDEVNACSPKRVGTPAFRPYGSPLEMRGPSR
jgi:hypothetical protein